MTNEQQAQLVSNCCRACPRLEVHGVEWNDEDYGICPTCGDRCEYVEEDREAGMDRRGCFTCPKCVSRSGWQWDCSVCGYRRKDAPEVEPTWTDGTPIVIDPDGVISAEEKCQKIA